MRSIFVTASMILCGAALSADEPQVLKYHDDSPDGKQSLGGSGEMIEFLAPAGTSLSGIRIHGSRYGRPQAPDEEFLIYVLSADRKRVLHTELAPYSLFERGDEKWVSVSFQEPLALPEEFWIALDFRANQRKGVYVSYDTSTKGKHSAAGLPGIRAAESKLDRDWMIEALLSSAEK
jgi:RNA polymerase sigma-70 factor (ECF subfamily)